MSLPLVLTAGAVLAGGASSGTGATGATIQNGTMVRLGAVAALVTAGPTSARAVTTPTVLHFNGNLPEDVDCTGDGSVDTTIDTCSNLVAGSGSLSTGPAAHWDPPNPALNGANARNIYDPNFLWTLAAPTTLMGPMTVDWWASCGGCVGGTLTAEWNIRIWVDANGATGLLPAFQEVVEATPATPNVPSKLTATVTLPSLTANSDFILHVDPVFIDTQQFTHVYYDSTLMCPGATTGPCDSTVTMPVLGTTGVQIVGFSSNRERGRVVLRWRTAGENGVAGFNVWRRGSGTEQRVNRELVAAAGRVGGASYRLVDRTARPGTTYTYRLQVVNRNGSRAWYGSARLQQAP